MFILGHYVPPKPSKVRHQDICDFTVYKQCLQQKLHARLSHTFHKFHKFNSNAKSLIADKPETIYTEMKQPPFCTRQAKKVPVSERLRHNPAGYTL